MKKLVGILAIALSVISCTAEPIEPIKAVKPIETVQTNTFTVVWESNQENSYAEFKKHVFKNCQIISTVTEDHRENRFDITLENGQMFDIQIKRLNGSTVKNPKITISIYKGSELQYSQTVYTNGFGMSNFTDHNGNIGK